MNTTVNPTEISREWLLRLYHFIPKEGPAIFAIIIFFLASMVIGYMTIRFKGHYMWVIVFSGLFEAIGYIIRIVSINKNTLGVFIGSTALLIITPIALAFVNYLVFGIILKQYDRKLIFLRPKWIAGGFLTSDILAFVLQLGASGLLVSKDTKMQNIGRNIFIVGFVFQLIFFTCFIWLTLHATVVSPRFRLFRVKSLRMTFIGLWVTIGLIFARNIFRAVEYIVPSTSPVVTYEWPFYVFEFGPIALSMVGYCVFHFGKYLPADGAWVEHLKAHKIEIKKEQFFQLDLPTDAAPPADAQAPPASGQMV
jgi:hypothetical protein